MLVMLLNVVWYTLLIVSNNLSFFSASTDMMHWRGQELLITYVNLAIYTSKLKVFAKLRKESEIQVRKWSVY